MPALSVFSICLLGVSMAAAQTEPTLKVGAKSYALSELLERPDVEAITVKHDPAYGGREMRYRAIRAAALFAETNLRDDEVMQVRCLDGFAAAISKERIMCTNKESSMRPPTPCITLMENDLRKRCIRDGPRMRTLVGAGRRNRAYALPRIFPSAAKPQPKWE